MSFEQLLDNQHLTIADVYSPLQTAQGVMQMNALKDKMDEAKIWNRIYTMQADTMQEERNAFTKMGGNPALQMSPETQGMRAKPQGMNALNGMGQPQNMGQANVQAKMIEQALRQQQIQAAIKEQEMIPVRQDAMSRLISSNPGTPEFEQAKIDYFRAGGKDPAVIKSLVGSGKDKAPVVHTFTEGDETVGRQWNPEKKEWVEVSRGKKSGEKSQGQIEQFREFKRMTPAEQKEFRDFQREGKLAVHINAGQGNNPDPFSRWSPDDKKWWFDATKSTGEKPMFGWGDKISRSQYSKEYAQYLRGAGITGRDTAAERGEVKSLTASLQNQEKQRGMMGSFVGNLNAQVDRITQIEADLKNRVGVRAIDYPVRELKMRFFGSGSEKVIEAYLTEISNEIGKLSTGSQESIRELGENAQKKWATIHDPALSLKEIKKILEETKKMGAMRLKSADDEIVATKKKIAGGEPKPTSPTSKKPSDMSNDEILEALRK